MRVLYLPYETSRMFNQDGCKRAWKRIVGEHNVVVYSYILENEAKGREKMIFDLERLIAADEFDVMFMQIQENTLLKPDNFARIKRMKPHLKIVNWCGDYRPYVMTNFLEIGKVIDLSLLSNKGQLEFYRQQGIRRIEYSQVGMDVSVFRPLGYMKERKIVFCGNRSCDFEDSKKRDELLLRMKKEFGEQFEIYGTNHWGGIGLKSHNPMYHYELNEMLNHALISIGINAINSLPFYFSERQIQHMASGTMHICHYVPGLETYFRNKYHCLWYKTIDECVDLCKKYIEHTAVCNEIGGYGAKAIQDGHTWDIRYKEVLDML